MRILLDESLPRQLAQELPGHEVQIPELLRALADIQPGQLVRVPAGITGD